MVALLCYFSLVACTHNQDPPGSEYQQYVDAIAANAPGSPGVSNDDRCIAEAIVREVGVSTLHAAGSPADIAESGTFYLSRFNLPEINVTQAAALLSDIDSCSDPRELVVEGLSQDQTNEVKGCVRRSVDDAIAGEILVAIINYGQDWTEANPRLQVEITARVQDCG